MTRAALVLAAATAACTHSSSGKVEVVDVYAFAGDTDPAPGATISVHDANGVLIDTVTADGAGHGQAVIQDGALISVVFPGDLSPLSTAAQVVTTLAPAAGTELDIHGPPRDAPSQSAGVLTIAPTTPLSGATSYQVVLGCTTTQLSSLPATIDVNARCLGSDENLDVLVTGTGSQGGGYAAGRLAFGTGSATFAPSAWETTYQTIPFTTDFHGGAEWDVYADGLPFPGGGDASSVYVPDGLAADAAVLTARDGDAGSMQMVRQYFDALPTAVSFTSSEFLPSFQSSLTETGTTFSWSAVPAGADLVTLHMQWQSPTDGRALTWDAILPPDATNVTFPAFGGDLATLVPPPSQPPLIQYSAVAAPSPESFDQVLAGGLYVYGLFPTIVPRPSTGTLRASWAEGSN